MGAFTSIDPSTIRPMPGKCVVEIVEVLGGTTKGGIHIPGALVGANMGKDTFYGKFVEIGKPPALEHYKSGPGSGWDVRPNKSGNVWPAEVMDQFQVGDIGIFPRDVELVFVWDGHRYGICYLHEAICVIPGDSFDPSEFEFVPTNLEGDQ